MFIKNLTIKNLKCFANKTVENFGVPNGQKGSGLNILIGENGNGKTTLLEAINYLTLNTYSVENKVSIGDFNDFRQPIEIVAEMDTFECSSSIDFYRDWSFKANGITFTVKSRGTKERNKLLSSEYDSSVKFNVTSQYIGGQTPKDVDSRDASYSPSRIKDSGINIFYFDKNRNRQIATGNYKTTFEKILEDFNWKFRHKLDQTKEQELVSNISGEFFKNISSISSAGAGSKTADALSDFFDNPEFKNLRIDLLSFLEPFNNGFFTLRKEDELKQVLVKDLGSGVEIILTLLLLKNIAESSKNSIVYLIDEPELHLHPKAQAKLLELLLEESKDKQIFLTTHSPYMFKGAVGLGANLFVLKHSGDDVEINLANDNGWGIFGRYSPTWGEINWFAYDLPTIEFHNELYGYLEANYKAKLDSIEKTHKWLDKRKLVEGDTTESKEAKKFGVSIQEYIRHSIHHPENIENDQYTDEELRTSINQMAEILKESNNDSSI